MTEWDRETIDRALPPAAGSPDWADVLIRARLARRGRVRVVALVAAAVAITLGTASAFGTVRDFFLDRGFIGLPPRGATTSAPESGDLVVSFWGKFAGDPPGKSRVLVYGDGRMIVNRGADLPEGANRISSGYLERRLTVDGVEVLLSKLLATGLFEHDARLLKDGTHEYGYSGEIHVRNRGRLVAVDWEDPGGYPPPREGALATAEQARALERVHDLFADPESSLPDTAWAERKVKAYVPSRYAVCFGGESPHDDVSRMLTVLPAPARELLGGSEFRPYAGSAFSCTDLTTDDARVVAEALDAAGLPRFDEVESYVLAYRLETLGPIRFIEFEPYLPHGEWICTPCA